MGLSRPYKVWAFLVMVEQRGGVEQTRLCIVDVDVVASTMIDSRHSGHFAFILAENNGNAADLGPQML